MRRRELAVAVAAAVTALACPPAHAQMVIKIATVNAGDNPRNVAANELGKQLSAKSGGKIKGEVYLNNQLAKGEAAMLEATQLGTIDIVAVGAAPIGGMFEPGYQPLVAALPLAEPRSMCGRRWTAPLGAGAREEDGGQGPQGAVLRRRLGLPQHACRTSAPITSPADMKGADDPRAAVARLHRHDEAARREPGADALERGLSSRSSRARSTRWRRRRSRSCPDKYHEVGKYYSLTKHTYEPITWFANMQEVRRAVRRPPEGGGRVGQGRLRARPQSRGRERGGRPRDHEEGRRARSTR